MGFLLAAVGALAAAAQAPICAIDPQNATSRLPQCAWYNSSLSNHQRANALLAEMSWAEKISVMQGAANPRLQIPSHGFSEASHGVAWSGRATVFPCSMAIGATFNNSLAHQMGRVVAHEGLAKHWNTHRNALSFFAPNINIVRDVRWGRAQETYGEDPVLSGVLGASFISGMQHPNGTGSAMAVRSVAKHFAAYNLESNYAVKNLPLSQYNGQYRLGYDANVSRPDLLQTFLPAFESIVQEGGVRGIMCAYNAVNGVPLCANELIAKELRGRMGFDGIVITDCGAIGFMESEHKWGGYNASELVAKTVAAGTDLNCGGEFSAELSDAFKRGMISTAQIETAVNRSVMGWLELGLLQDTATSVADWRRHVSMEVVDGPDHRKLAREAAQQSLVLLKNVDSTLPLQTSARRGSPRKLAVVGPNANRSRTLLSNYAGCTDKPGGDVDPECTLVNPLQGLMTAVQSSPGWEDDVAFADGVEIDTHQTSGIAAAVSAASDADAVVFIGGLITCQENGDQCQEAEARDRSTPLGTSGPLASLGRDVGIALPGSQLACLQAIAESNTSASIILVIMSGSAVAVPWPASSPRISAVLQAFYPGALGGSALADVLFGAVAPSGRLPVMIPVSEDQLPSDYLDQSMMAPPGRTHRYFTGTPLFGFGFGLGYSTFRYSGLSASHSELDSLHSPSHIELSVTITNNGEFTGVSEEVVLCFAIPKPSVLLSQMAVPRQMLLAFKRVVVRGGEQVRATLTIPVKRLHLVGGRDQLELVGGEYELHVGGRAPGTAGLGTAGRGVPEPLRTALRVNW